MTFQIIWFILWGVLWALYFMLDGFDLGAGCLYPWLARTDSERAAVRASIGPVWDGNEVWLLAAGGSTFAAFPAMYASMFSFFYTALLLILFALILRGVALEFRAKGEGKRWTRVWDGIIPVASLVAALFFGAAFGNIFRGLPFDAAGNHGTFLALLNPYSLLTGLFFVVLFLVHGALWLAMKIGGDFGAKALRTANGLWFVLFVSAAAFFVLTPFSTELGANYLRHPAWLAVPVLALLALVEVKLHAAKKQAGRAFGASCALIVLVMATGLVGLYPNLLPSRLDPARSLTIFNASSSPYTLRIMTIVVLVFVPVVIGYQLWVYKVFRGKIAVEERDSGVY
jgi:cytochrome bd ubiquinol oxidase subunit II